MRIIIDARMYGLEHAGVGRYLINLIKELKKAKSKKRYVIFLRNKYFNQLNFPSNWTKVLADYPHYTLIEQIKLPALIKKYHPDLVHFPHFNIPVGYRGNFVVTIHDMTMHQQGIEATNQPLYKYFLKKFAYRYAFRKAVLNSTLIVVPTKAVRNEVTKYFGIKHNKVKVIYEGINKNFLKQITKEKEGKVLRKYRLQNKKYFFYYGNVYPHKNVKKAIEAIIELNEKQKEKILFVIASSRSVFTERLGKLVRQAKTSNLIKFLGFVPDEKLLALLKKSIAFVYPSVAEGFGLQGLEAMGVGTLVLASDIPVFKEIYKENALYFNPASTVSIEERMGDALMMSTEKRKSKIISGKKFVLRYSWSKMARQTLKIYNESCTSLRPGE